MDSDADRLFGISRVTLEEHCPECQHPERWQDRDVRGCPNCSHVSRRAATLSFLRSRINADWSISPDRAAAFTHLLDSILGYESNQDGEFGCCHDPVDIEFGECRQINPDNIPALKSLVTLLQP